MRGTDVTDFKRTYRTAHAGEFPDELTVSLEKEQDLRYGENPNQPAAVYRFKGDSLAELTNIRLAKSGKGGLSATNFMDITRGLEILKYFPKPAVAVMKHLIPSGFAVQHEGNRLVDIYENARDADARSSFGSVVVFNTPVNQATAEALVSTYVEGVAAPEFEFGAMGILEKKRDLRAILYSNLDKLPKFVGDDTKGIYDLKALPTGRVIAQAPYLTSIRGKEDLVLDPLVRYKEKKEDVEERSVVVERDPTDRELEDLLTAWYINFGVRSNGIVIVKNGVTLAVGSGQQERVGAVEQAITKAYQKARDRAGIEALFNPLQRAWAGPFGLEENPLEGSVASSDAFFPFADSVDLLGSDGVTAVIQPGGSQRDYEVIQAVNDHNMAMVFTLERCFGHF